jgi:hypothetical protein
MAVPVEFRGDEVFTGERAERIPGRRSLTANGRFFVVTVRCTRFCLARGAGECPRLVFFFDCLAKLKG